MESYNGSSSKDSLAVSYKTKHTIITRPNNCTIEHLSQKKENVYSHENLSTKANGNFICNSQISIYSMEYCPGIQRDAFLERHNNFDESLGNYAERKKNILISKFLGKEKRLVIARDKNIYSYFIDYPKAFTMWIMTNCGKLLRR